ncbi:MAG: AAA family ATPase [Treponema sp.]
MELLVEQSSSYEKCLKKITQKHGDDFTVVRRKDCTIPRFFGLVEAEAVEVSFYVNDRMSSKYPAPRTPEVPPVRPVQKLNDREEQLKIVKGYAEKNPAAAEQLQQYMSQLQKKAAASQAAPDGKTGEDAAVQMLAESIARLLVKAQQEQMAQSETEHPHIVKAAKLLEENDFAPAYIEQLSVRLKNELSYTEIENFQTVQKKLFAMLADSVKIKLPDTQIKTRIILLVGPTGVGKTTTLAKIAALYIGKKSKVNVITIDNWRIGAAYQMQRYCELMGIKLMVASKPAEVRAYMDIYREEADVICIDTIGRSPNDREKLANMQEYFAELGDDAEIYLTVCAGTRLNDIREIMKQYEVFKYKSLIITKFDETSSIGNIFSIIAETSIPVTYITAGQAVPQDFLAADAEVFLNKLKGFSVDHEYISELCDRDKNQFLKVSVV